VEPTSDDRVMSEVKLGEVFQEGDFYLDGVAVVYQEKDGQAVVCKLVKSGFGAMSRRVTFKDGTGRDASD